MRIAIIGYGGVGRAFVKLLFHKKEELLREGIDVKINYIISGSGGVYDSRGINIENFIQYSNENKDINNYPIGGSKFLTFSNLLDNKDVDTVIEMTPTNLKDGEPGMTHIKKSLENGLNVITANKGPILLHYNTLKKIAIKNNVQLGIGCTTGGALPTINGGIFDMAGSKINSIEGVLNGTTNFIINEMEKNSLEYSEALKKAQQMGIAETDPTLDIEGWDTATKLLILTNVLMNEDKTMNDIKVEGITSINLYDVQEAIKQNMKYKLIGRTTRERDDLKIVVKMEKVGVDNFLYSVDGKNKAVKYTSDTLGDLTIIGGASGVTAAAASILRDMINIYRGYKFN